MAKKKTKEEKTPKSKANEVTSSIENNDWAEAVMEEMKQHPEDSSMEDFENSEQNKKAADVLIEELKEAKEQVKLKLHVLADDRLNSLINRANELGITDVVQILNSDKFGQFYLVYKE